MFCSNVWPAWVWNSQFALALRLGLVWAAGGGATPKLVLGIGRILREPGNLNLYTWNLADLVFFSEKHLERDPEANWIRH